MSNDQAGMITQVLQAAAAGDPKAGEQLLPLLYGELRRLAQSQLGRTPPGNTFQPTALVHEAYLRLVGSNDPGWDGRGHFFAAAAESMRQILVDQARRKGSLKRGGGRRRFGLDVNEPVADMPGDDLIALDEALQTLERSDERAAKVVKLRFFAGLTMDETAKSLNISIPTAERDWRFARTFLASKLNETAD
jgi:RNA polymerase sigma factor (TIGR02999 family)